MMRLSDQSDINQTEALQAQACVEWVNKGYKRENVF